ncbi:GntR family transcriptional regulator [Asticcacaulis sp. 201]|uniref:GntR family transcriptional regulator n=1 Tax=Asticcacaulis sp. 201 TaxID=3028787 RepID=UPI002916508E|nr:GntR family transcriptional regulator [Asticcacaulis sp. 201]MDV6331275.1 GntR family transcriptional regulator [Asticcacaulis sp. 201]
MSFFNIVPPFQASSGPLYVQLERILRSAILDGRLSDSDALPPERDMAEQYGVSRLTVRKALSDLQSEGLLTRRRGCGTFVSAKPRVEGNLSAFQEDLVTSGQGTHSVWLERGIDRVTPDESMTLGVAPGTQVYRFRRLRFKETRPVAIEHSVLLLSCLTTEAAVEGSIYAAMHKSGNGPVRALQRIRAVLLQGNDAHMLDVAPQSAGLFMERRGFLADGRTAEVTHAWFRGDAADLIAEVSVQEPMRPNHPGTDISFAIAV